MALTKISTGGVKDDAASQAKIADEAVDEARLQISNAGTNGQFLQKSSGTGGLEWATVDTNLVSDTSPQLGGNLDVNTKNITFGDSADGTTDDVLKFGAGTDLSIYSDGTKGMIETPAGQILEFKGASGNAQWSRNDSFFVTPNLNVTTQVKLNGQAGTSGQVLTSSGTSSAPQWADAGGGAFSHFDAWDLGGGANNLIPQAFRWNNDILGQNTTDRESPLYRVSNLTPVGSGMSQTDGVFTFPATGMWKIDFFLVTKMQSVTPMEVVVMLQRSTDSGSNWTDLLSTRWYPAEHYQIMNRSYSTYFNCASTSTNRFRISMRNNSSKEMQCVDATSITFLKIA